MNRLRVIRELLTDGQNEFQRRLSRLLVDRAVSEYQVWRRTTGEAGGLRDALRPIYGFKTDRTGREPLPAELALAIDLHEFLVQSLQQTLDQQTEWREAFAVFQRIFTRAPSESERRRLILEFAARLGATPRQLKQDNRAFDRFFGFDTIVERFHRIYGESEQWTEFLLTWLGRLSARLLGAAPSPESRRAVWQQLEWNTIYETSTASTHNFRVTVALHEALLGAIRSLSCKPAIPFDWHAVRLCEGRGEAGEERVGKGDGERVGNRSIAERRDPPRPSTTQGVPPTCSLGDTERGHVLEDSILQSIRRVSLDRTQNVWVQAAALSLLAEQSPLDFRRTAENRLTKPDGGDDVFVRRRAVELLAEHGQHLSNWQDLVIGAAQDTSPFVRQAVARMLTTCLSNDPARMVLHHLMTHDLEPSVRAAALVEVGQADERVADSAWFIACLQKVIAHESDVFVLRTALWVIADRIDRLASSSDGEKIGAASILGQELMRPIRQLQETAESLPVRHWAAQAAERIWMSLDPPAQDVRRQLEPRICSLDPHRTARVSRRLLRKYGETIVGRALSVFAQEDYGFDIEQGWWFLVVRRGPQVRFRLWRLWHEMRHPSPDKRQAFRHTVGRVSDANIRIPSGIMGELSPTKVPGEPLHLPEDQSWRAYLPLVDDVLSSLNQWIIVRPVRFYTASGVTSLTPPQFWLGRLVAWARLTFGFQKYAALRNWTAGNDNPPQGYVQSLRDLGFRVNFQPYFDDGGLPVAVDGSVHRFFDKADRLAQSTSDSLTPERAPAGERSPRREPPRVPASTPYASPTVEHSVTAQTMLLPVLAMPRFAESALRWFDDYSNYFTSVYENTVAQLLLFVGVVFALFFLRQFWLTRGVRRARKSLCLTVGGWGTRGKSGTERLKGAVFNALGFGLVSKSTGCEAMFLHASTYGELRELILYRPYDKATIWEHAAVLQMAGRLGVPVFLWECMGLNPAYVNVLQQQWSQDDLSTITNAYPDHEDIQGPAGINVAESISSFIPVRSTMFTTESQMRPVLQHQARRQGTVMHKAGWLESGLLTPDVLARFPYNEHPDNIALVVMLAGALGCPADFTLKEMADRLVPDLGVLKTFPPSSIGTRTLVFSNGMSANERHGTLNNWTRLGFDRHDPAQEPGTWITTVVNNRADRIARSRVFAAMLVNDLPADRHFLIGGNLMGLRGYIREAWNEWVATVTLQPREDVNPNLYALTILKKMAKRLRVPTDETQIHRLLEVMLRGVATTVRSLPAEALLTELLPLWSEPEQIATRLTKHGIDESLIRDVKRDLQDTIQRWNEFHQLAERLKSATAAELHDSAAALDGEFHSQLWQWFERKLVVVEDYHATGEQIINLIATHTPPGVRNRVMGIQNIKGTGLDFVYRWMAWQACFDVCEHLRSTDEISFRRALRLLGEFREFGLLSEKRVRQALQDLRNVPLAQREDVLAQLELIQSNFETELQRVHQELKGKQQKGTRFAILYKWLEEFMDATDAVRRRKAADQIYRDLANEHISRDLAVVELRNLTQRQKGGWLA